jgi:hypothetical protein
MNGYWDTTSDPAKSRFVWVWAAQAGATFTYFFTNHIFCDAGVTFSSAFNAGTSNFLEAGLSAGWKW